MPRYFGLYLGTSEAGHHFLKHVVGSGYYRDHNWLHKDYNQVPENLQPGQVVSFDALPGSFHGHPVLRAAQDFEVVIS